MSIRAIKNTGVLVACAALLLACGDGDTDTTADATETENGSEPADELQSVTVMAVPTGSAPTFVAYEMGYWLDLGLDVSLVSATTGSSVMQAFGAGEADFVSSSLGGTVQSGRAGGLDMVALVPTVNDSRYISAFERGGLLARSDAGIDPEDPTTLRGKTVGVQEGTVVDTYLTNYLQAHGMDRGDIEVVNVPLEDVAISLEQGLIDAGLTVDPFVPMIVRTQDVIVVSRGEPLAVDISVMAASAELLESDPEVVEKLITGILQASKLLRDDPESGVDLLTSYIEGVTYEDLLESVTNVTYDPRVSVCTLEGTSRVSTQLLDSGRIDQEPGTAEEIVNTSILDTVLDQHPELVEDLDPNVPATPEECEDF